MDANQMNSGLLRYRSAPSSFFGSFLEGEEDFLNSQHHHHHHHRSSSPEAETTMFARFMSEIGDKPGVKAEAGSSQFMAVISEETEQQQMAYRPPPPAMVVNHGGGVGDNVYHQHSQQLKMGSGNASNLIRHSSSPAGLFANLNVENGYAVMRGIGNYRTGNVTSGDAVASTSRLKNQMNFSSATPSSSGLMSPISEIESESIGTNTADGGSLGNGNISNQYNPNFPATSWDDSALENFSSLKRYRDGNAKMNSDLHSPETQLPELGNQTRNLTHHFSLPKNSAEMAAILQFQDSVPCKIRAKRGCATHPRSIAERVRRTRISERMRKLQELVPNMDKQTNTADMLDLAVEYIKELQTHVQKLNDNRANCTCPSKQASY